MKAKTALIAAIATVGIASSAQARPQVFVDMTGWQTWQGFHLPGAGANTGTIVAGIGAGSSIDNIEFVNITIDSLGASWNSEFVASVNSWNGVNYTSFWDSQIPGTTDTPGVFGPFSGNFNNPGWYGSGPFVLGAGENDLYVTVYENFNDGGNGTQDAQVISGGILITYTPIPAPGALALLGLAGLVGSRRRRA